MRLRAQTEPADRARTLRAIAEVAEATLGDPSARRTALLRALAEEPQDATLHAEIERLAARAGRTAGSGTPTRCRSARLASSTPTSRRTSSSGSVGSARSSSRTPRAPRRPTSPRRAHGRRRRRPRRARPALRPARRHRGARRRARAAHRGRSRRGGAGRAPPPAREPADQRVRREERRASRRCGRRSSGCRSTREPRCARELLDDDALFDDAFEALEYVLRTLGLSEDLAKLYERRVKRARTRDGTAPARASISRACSRRRAATAVARSASSRRRSPRTRPTIEALQELERLADDQQVLGGGRRRARRALEAATDLPASDAHGSLGPPRRRGAATGSRTRAARRTRSRRRSASIRRTSTSSARSRTSVARPGASASSSTRCARAPASRATSRPSASCSARPRGSPRAPSRTASWPRPCSAISSPRTRGTSGRSRS